MLSSTDMMKSRSRNNSFLLGLSFSMVISLLCLSLMTAEISAESNAEAYNSRSAYSMDRRNAQQPSGPVYRPVPPKWPQKAEDPSIIVVPRLGLVRGIIDYKRIRGRGVNAFLGLKYGTVNPGLGRFQKADNFMPSDSNAIFDAIHIPKNCPQFPDLDKVNASEARGENVDDCLTLNIFAPNRPGLYPVLVFVHGEMLFDGSAEEGQPDYLLEHDVVLVNINYRLAPFGFLTTLTDEMPGNAALADIQLALEWIQQYIRPFGGNADQVTLMGQAGGATLVHALSVSGKAQGLFHKLILQSGTVLNPYLIDETPLMTIKAIARLARCYYSESSRSNSALHECFARMSTTELLSVMKKHWTDNEAHGLRFLGGFKLAVGDRLGYLPQNPVYLVGNITVPVLAGVTKDAGAFIMSRVMREQLSELHSPNITDYINVVLKHTAPIRYHQLWTRTALEHIFSDEDKRAPAFEKIAQGLLELVNLIMYRGPLIDSIRYTYKKYPTFLYCFDYRGQFHRFSHLSNPLPFEADATLSDDNTYLFPYPEEVSQLNPVDKTLSRALTTMWVNFAQYNRPNLNVGVWPNATTEYGPFVRITNNIENTLELDYHFSEGIPVPNLYPEYFTTTTTTTTRRPNRPNYQSYPTRYPNYAQTAPPHNFQPPPPPPYRTHETVLNGGEHSSKPDYRQWQDLLEEQRTRHQQQLRQQEEMERLQVQPQPQQQQYARGHSEPENSPHFSQYGRHGRE